MVNLYGNKADKIITDQLPLYSWIPAGSLLFFLYADLQVIGAGFLTVYLLVVGYLFWVMYNKNYSSIGLVEVVRSYMELLFVLPLLLFAVIEIFNYNAGPRGVSLMVIFAVAHSTGSKINYYSSGGIRSVAASVYYTKKSNINIFNLEDINTPLSIWWKLKVFVLACSMTGVTYEEMKETIISSGCMVRISDGPITVLIPFSSLNQFGNWCSPNNLESKSAMCEECAVQDHESKITKHPAPQPMHCSHINESEKVQVWTNEFFCTDENTVGTADVEICKDCLIDILGKAIELDVIDEKQVVASSL